MPSNITHYLAEMLKTNVIFIILSVAKNHFNKTLLLTTLGVLGVPSLLLEFSKNFTKFSLAFIAYFLLLV